MFMTLRNHIKLSFKRSQFSFLFFRFFFPSIQSFLLEHLALKGKWNKRLQQTPNFYSIKAAETWIWISCWEQKIRSTFSSSSSNWNTREKFNIRKEGKYFLEQLQSLVIQTFLNICNELNQNTQIIQKLVLKWQEKLK